VVMAGPCSVESAEMIEKTALYVREKGAHILRTHDVRPAVLAAKLADAIVANGG